MSNAIEIRDARADDAPVLAGLLAELGFPSAPEMIATRLDAMQRAGEVVLVAVGAGTPLGLASLHVTPVLHRPTSVGRITALIVTEGARGRGVGRALVEAAERILAAKGCALIELTSNHRLQDAHAFYQRLGYEATSKRFKKSLE